MRTYILLLGIIFSSTLPADVLYISGTLERVVDGDTIVVTENGEHYKVRLFGIDAPELAQPSGDQAKSFVHDFIAEQPLTVLVFDVDRYGRFVGEVMVAGQSLNRSLVSNGWAWWYQYFADEDDDLERLQQDAKAQSRGLWAQNTPQAPWDFRRFGPPTDDTPVPDSPDPLITPVEDAIIFPSLSGDDLAHALRTRYKPNQTLSYRQARQQMFSHIDNHNGRVTLVYTGRTFATTGIPNHTQVNTEHTWPQSKFNRKLPMRSDLHHLFPTFSQVNSSRGSSPFAEIDDAVTEKWWQSDTFRTSIPEVNKDEYSEATRQHFEPREAHKGNVARAMVYFLTIYGDRNIQSQWGLAQMDTLLEWHKADPVDNLELQRSAAIAAIQGNENPFVLDATLFQRVLTQ